jgi:ParB-like chromosome segregation protein Spo0J
MKIEQLAIDHLIPYARNSRTHSDEQVAQVAASIREFGFTNPVLVDAEGGIIAGHGRVMAARKLGLAEVPCIRLAHLTEAQKRAYVIADNKLALNAGWDEQMLALELHELHEFDFDLAVTGFSDAEINRLVSLLDGGPAAGAASEAGIVYQEKFAVLVECSGEANQAEIYNKLTGMGLACKVLVN